MTGTAGCGMYLQRCSMERSLLTEDILSKNSSKSLFSQGIQLVHGLKAKMKNKLMHMWDKIMLRKRYIIECINELLKNKANLVHSRHRSIHNFDYEPMFCALTAYCFFDNKPEALPVYVEKSRQLDCLHTDFIPNSSITCTFQIGSATNSHVSHGL